MLQVSFLSQFMLAIVFLLWASLTLLKKHDCDLIVMASHGRRGLGRMLLGSQTTEVLGFATLPVLVLR